MNCRVPVHRLVLSASTDYFDSLLTSEFKEQQNNEVELKNICGATLQSVIHFFYTGRIEINKENAESLLAAASFLLSHELQQKCTEYFEQPDLIDTSNCIGIWTVASKYAFHDLKAAAAEVIFDEFMEVSKNDEFPRLNEADLVELLGNDKLNVSSEEDVLNAVVNWVQFGVDERRFLFPQIVRAVRVSLFSTQFMTHNVFSVCKRFGCIDTFVELCEVKNDPNIISSERSPAYPDLLAIKYEMSGVAFETFSQRLQQWKVHDENTEKTCFAAELVGIHLYLIGGWITEQRPHTVVNTVSICILYNN